MAAPGSPATFKGIDIRQSGDRIIIRASLKDSSGVKVTAAPTVMTLYEVQNDGSFKSYDFNDNTFKTGALTTPTLALTHRTGNNATTNTGIWSVAITTVTGFTRGNLYIAQVNNAGASPVDQEREFQYGDADGDLSVTADGLAYAATIVRRSTAQAGAAGTITLDASASAVDSFYRGASIIILSGTGAGQQRLISAYVGSTKVASVLPNWTTNPDSTSIFAVTGWNGVDLVTGAGSTIPAGAIPNAVAGAAGGVFIAGVNAATTANITGNLTGNVTGSVGSVTGAVGSVTGNVGGNVTGSVGSVIGAVGSVTGGVTVTTNNDKTGYSLTVAPPTVAAIATAVWQDVTAGDFTTASSIGKSLYTAGVAPGAAGGLFIAGANAAVTANITGNITGNLSGSAGSVVGAVGSVAGNVGGNVVGTVASVVGAVGSIATGGIVAASFGANAITAAVIAPGAIDNATYAADTGKSTIRSNTAQAGAASTITLDAGASAVDNFYTNDLIAITGGTGAGQSRFISGYVGGTKVATVGTNWVTNPDATSTFAILPFDAIPGATAPSANTVADAVLKRDLTAISGEAANSLLNAIRVLRHWAIVGTTLTAFKEDGTSVAWTATIGTNAGGLPVSSQS